MRLRHRRCVNIFLVRLAPWLLIAASFVLLGWGLKKVLLGGRKQILAVVRRRR